MLHAPWTDTGALQQEMNDIKQQLRGKTDDYKMAEANRRLGALEHSVQELSNRIDELLSRLERVEAKKGGE